MKTLAAVVGVGMSAFGPRMDKGYQDLFAEAYREALADADRGLDPVDLDRAYIGHQGVGGGQLAHVGPHVCAWVGLPHLPVVRVENACASSSYAFQAAVGDVASGRSDVALVGGVEKITEISGAKVREWMGVAGDVEWDRLSGLTFPGVFAMAAMMHMDRYGTSRDDLCRVAVKNHANGSYNPKAHLRRRIDLDRTRTAPMVSYPLNLFDCCVNSSGAAVLIVCRPDRADRYTSRPVWVLGMGSATDHPNIALRPDPAGFEATRVAARRAYGEAGIGPADVDVAEVHDCFTIAEIMAYEDLGFCRPGEGGRLIGEGRTLLSGDIPVNPSGGLKSKGHPIGATGAAQIYEIAHQLRGDVIGPERQVKDARVGLTHNMGGFGATATVNLFGV